MINARLAELGITLPEAASPLFHYIPVVVHNGIAYVSGQVPRINGHLPYMGKVGTEVTIEEAKQCAEICVLRALSVLEAELGNLDRVERVLRINGYVQSALGFSQQPKVIDRASELLTRIFGENGRHARTAIGVAELPSNSPVEIDFMFAIKQ